MLTKINKFLLNHTPLLKAFGISESSDYVNKLVFIARVLFAIILLHRSFDVYGFAILHEDPGFIQEICVFTIIIGFSILLGFLTPIAILCYMFFFCLEPKYSFSLYHMSCIIFGWSLLFFGAGKHYSIDSWASKNFPGYEKLQKIIYFLAVEINTANVATIRFFAILLYYGNAVAAMSYHFYDPLWLQAKTLQLMFTTGYLNDFYWLFENWRQSSPYTFDFILRTAMIIQGIWELLMLPMMFSRWGRLFVFLQGIGFFILSVLIINLGYLPLVEIVLWALLFAYPSSYNKEKTEARSNNDFKIDKKLLTVAIVGTIAFSSFIGTIVYVSAIGDYERIRKINRGWLRKAHRFFAQDRVNVFNRADLNMGSNNIVLYELNSQGKKVRQVPFQNEDGARLSYLNNDLLYFQYSLRWQRLDKRLRYANGDLSKPGPRTVWLAQKVALLDFCLSDQKIPKIYQMEIHSRNIHDISLAEIKGSSFVPYNDQIPAWTESKQNFTGKMLIDEKVKQQIMPACKGTYNLGPGHFSPMDL